MEKEQEFYRDLCLRYSRRIQELPSGNLYFKKEHGKHRPYLRKQGKEHYLPREKADAIQKLFERKCLERALRAAGGNLELLKSMGEKYVEFAEITPAYIKEEMEKKLKTELPEFAGKTLLQSRDREIEEWLAMPTQANPYMPENKKHITPGGVKVRSKSELVIGALLESDGIPYRYEAQLILEGQELYPDFTIRRPSDGKEVIWEHYGMMDDPAYRSKCLQKGRLYEKCGYLPFDNFIATYDDGNGSLDMVLLQRIVDILLK